MLTLKILTWLFLYNKATIKRKTPNKWMNKNPLMCVYDRGTKVEPSNTYIQVKNKFHFFGKKHA